MAYLIFDLPHENDSKGIHIPAASLKLSKLDNARKLFLCVEAGSSVLLPEDISPSEILRTHQMLTALNAVLLNELAKASIAAGGTVGDECDGCYWEEKCWDSLSVMPCVLAEAGIDPDDADNICSKARNGEVVLTPSGETATYKIMSALSSEDRIRLIEAGVSLAGLFLLLKEELEDE